MSILCDWIHQGVWSMQNRASSMTGMLCGPDVLVTLCVVVAYVCFNDAHILTGGRGYMHTDALLNTNNLIVMFFENLLKFALVSVCTLASALVLNCCCLVLELGTQIIVNALMNLHRPVYIAHCRK
jgi:hypothetical protein